ncbi:MAG: hypothetical protein CMH55_07725 [Myxococcales bacterium]|nr:hypothetical protein [Myxococcales bacterium]|tara:strand:- start:552 stop:833 length:282 start_codon:yes stop_codon:yes gene_type:complete
MLAELIEKLPKACFVTDAEFSRELGLVGETGCTRYRMANGNEIVVKAVAPSERFVGWPPAGLCAECELPLPAHPLSESGVCPDCFFGERPGAD